MGLGLQVMTHPHDMFLPPTEIRRLKKGHTTRFVSANQRFLKRNGSTEYLASIGGARWALKAVRPNGGPWFLTTRAQTLHVCHIYPYMLISWGGGARGPLFLTTRGCLGSTGLDLRWSSQYMALFSVRGPLPQPGSSPDGGSFWAELISSNSST